MRDNTILGVGLSIPCEPPKCAATLQQAGA